MLKEGESVLGLHITQQGIKIAELKKSAAAIELTAAETISLLTEATKDEGFFIEPKYEAAALTGFLKSRGISSKKAVFVLDSPHIVTRLIRLPFISKDDMRYTLENEVNQYADFKNKEKIIDFSRIEEISEEGVKKVNVLFAAVLKKTIDYFIALAEIANLELLGVECGNLAVIRALNEVNLKSEVLAPVMLIIINMHDAQLCVLKGNRLRFVHDIKIETEKISGPGKEDFINKLIIAIRLALNYYEMSGLGGENILKIVVNSNVEAAKDMDKELTSRLLGLSIEKASPLGRLRIDNNKFSEEKLRSISITHAEVIGAALKAEDPQTYPLGLNLISPEKRKSMRLKKELPVYAAFLGVLLLCYLAAWVIFSINIWSLKKDLSKINQQLEDTEVSLDKFISELSIQDITEDKLREGAFLIAKIDASRPFLWSELIAEIMNSVQDEVWLSAINADVRGDIITVQGYALSEKLIFDYVNILSNYRHFESVNLVSSQTQGAFLRFLIKCKLKK
ncbi:MAG: hypothetical protein DRP74_03160 [Candidatus Omnitrophota bacterium]|nr:MAG: hypothetical protein DRP74_03160 [Candidatus Omnitrophota bacterium]